MAKAITKTSAQLRAEIIEAIDRAKRAIENGNEAARDEALLAASTAEKDYAIVHESEVYKEIYDAATAEKKNPVIEAVRAYSFTVARHKVIKETGSEKILDVEYDTMMKRIDILKFCAVSKLNTMWQYLAQKFNQLMCLRLAKELKFTDAQLKELEKSYFLKEKVREMKMNWNPTSNTKLCAMLTEVVQAMCGDETLKANSHDLRYIYGAYTKRDNKERLTLKVSKDAFVRSLLADVAYRIVENAMYGINGFKVNKEVAESVAAPKVEPAPTPAPVATVETVEAEAVAA